MEKKFILRCSKCRFGVLSTGLSEDLKHLHEIKKCATCGGPRTFRCNKCGNGTMKLMRIKKNA